MWGYMKTLEWICDELTLSPDGGIELKLLPQRAAAESKQSSRGSGGEGRPPRHGNEGKRSSGLALETKIQEESKVESEISPSARHHAIRSARTRLRANSGQWDQGSVVRESKSNH